MHRNTESTTMFLLCDYVRSKQHQPLHTFNKTKSALLLTPNKSLNYYANAYE